MIEENFQLYPDTQDQSDREELHRMVKERDAEAPKQKMIISDWEWGVLESANVDMSEYTTFKRIAAKAGVTHVSKSVPRVLQQINFAFEKQQREKNEQG